VANERDGWLDRDGGYERDGWLTRGMGGLIGMGATTTKGMDGEGQGCVAKKRVAWLNASAALWVPIQTSLARLGPGTRTKTSEAEE
jgi:hypothetical protein